MSTVKAKANVMSQSVCSPDFRHAEVLWSWEVVWNVTMFNFMGGCSRFGGE
jgi:hypothetical protein